MTVHIVTETVTLTSDVVVSAPPGERPANVIDRAIEEVVVARESIGLFPPFTAVSVGIPCYMDGRKWEVRVVTKHEVSDIVKA